MVPGAGSQPIQKSELPLDSASASLRRVPGLCRVQGRVEARDPCSTLKSACELEGGLPSFAGQLTTGRRRPASAGKGWATGTRACLGMADGSVDGPEASNGGGGSRETLAVAVRSADVRQPLP
jgi:hypothetical protein